MYTTNGIDELLLNLNDQDSKTIEKVKTYYNYLYMCNRDVADKKLFILDNYYFSSFKYASFKSFCLRYNLNINSANSTIRSIRAEVQKILKTE